VRSALVNNADDGKRMPLGRPTGDTVLFGSTRDRTQSLMAWTNDPAEDEVLAGIDDATR